MAGRIIHDVSTAISAVAADGTITVGNTTGLYERAYAYLFLSGQPGETVRIVRILTVGAGGTITVRRVTDPRGNIIGQLPMGLTSGDYRNFNATAYIGGVISIPEQVIMNPNDLGLA
jgi:hypothetical protein